MKAALAMIAAFPPPVGGQSLAAQMLKDGLDPERFTVYSLDLAESIGGDPFVRRSYQLLGIAYRLSVLCFEHRELIVYLQLGHGRMSILRDLVYLLISKAFGKRCVVHVHGSGFRVALDALPRPLLALERYALSGVHCAIVLGDSLKGMFDELVLPERILSIDNGVEPELESDARSYMRETRDASLGFEILFLSNLLRGKGYALLLEVAKLAKAASKHWRFVFAGAKIADQGVDIDAFIAAEALEFVSFLGPVSGVRKWACYRSADLFVLPSYYEGQPLCILEAMHYGLPIVTTSVGGIGDIFNREAPFGAYVKPGDVDELYAAICLLADDKLGREAMGLSNQAHARERFTAKAHVAAVVGALLA